MNEADTLELLQRLGVGLGLGFLVGVERGYRHRAAPAGARAAGLRTHAVIGLLGGVCGALIPVVGQAGFAALTLAFATALIVFKVRESMADDDLSVTGTIAALLLYALGAYAMQGDLRVAAAAGVMLVLLLASKDALHAWLDKLTQAELRSALLILAATAIVLPLLPDRAIDPWGAFNPRELWLLTILVAGASFAGYVAVRVLGEDVGLHAGAAAGALVSSTVVTAELGRRVRAGEASAATGASAAALAALVSACRIGVFAGAVAMAAAPLLLPALTAAAVVFLGGAWLLNRLDHQAGAPNPVRALQSPLDLREVARFALLLGGVTVFGRIIADGFGQSGLLPFAAAAGMADADAVTLAVGSLMRGGLDASVGAHAILIGVLVNTFAKGAIALATGGWRYGALYLAVAIAASVAGATMWWFAAQGLTPRFTPEGSLGAGLFG